MNERIKQLREHLKLSQEKFGEIIGLSQRSISTFESGRNKLSERNINAICREFNVSAEWLREGKGAMFKQPQDGLNSLREEYDLNDSDIALIKSYLELPAEMRQAVIEFGRNFAENMKVKKPRVPDDQLSVDEKRRIVNGELDAEEKGQILFPSTGLNGMSKISKKKPEKNKPNS